MTDGAVLQIADRAALEKPLLIVFARAARDARAVTTRNVLRVGAGATATIVEAHVALPGAGAEAQSNAATDIRIEDGAAVTHVKWTAEGGKATHLATWVARLGSSVRYRPFQLTAGVGLARNQLFVTFKGEGTKLDLSGAFLARGAEHIDTTLVVDHAVPRCESRELFKGVLDGRARGVFQGKIIVRPDAQKTDGKQMAQALMLSEEAEFDSKPELEILADDVVCGHGSTSAEIDPALIFYCKSRGIPEAEARALLIEAFVGEAIEKVEHAALRGALRDIARGWLQQGTAGRAG
jgi:Fe-S cluster assembly protein SufD